MYPSIDPSQPNDLSFDSLVDFATFLDATPRADGAGESSSYHGASDDWDLGIGFDGAMDYAHGRDVWHAGASLLGNTVTYARSIRAEVDALRMSNSVAGFAPNVGAFVAGEPENMFTMEFEPAPADVVTIGFSGFSASCYAPAMLNRGAALLALVDVLESERYRVEVWFDGQIEGARWRVCLKSAGAHWDLTTMAYAIAHPGCYRRLTFAYREKFAECNWATCGGGYGMGECNGDFTFNLGHCKGNTGWTSLPMALTKVERLARKAGFDVTLTGKGEDS